MFGSAEKPISLVQATRTLYRTRTPTSDQVDQVFRLMKTGAMPARCGGDNRLKWTTTERDLAEFMANHRMRRADTRQEGVTFRAKADRQGKPGTGKPGEETSELKQVYRSIWRDYFLAVMARRRMAHRSAAFRRAVVAGQAIVLVLLIGLITGSIRQILAFSATPPEHQAIQSWIESQTDAFAVERWHPASADTEQGGLLLRVEYRYRKDSPRWVHTKRTFRVRGDHVAEVPEGD